VPKTPNSEGSKGVNEPATNDGLSGGMIDSMMDEFLGIEPMTSADESLPDDIQHLLGIVSFDFTSLDMLITIYLRRWMGCGEEAIADHFVLPMTFGTKIEQFVWMTKFYIEKYQLSDHPATAKLCELVDEARQINAHRNDLVHGHFVFKEGEVVAFSNMAKQRNFPAEAARIRDLIRRIESLRILFPFSALRFSDTVAEKRTKALG
jgi:hypothetical protein